MKGAVLPVVVVILLCVGFMVSALLSMPGGVLRKAKSLEKDLQTLYDSESRMLMHLEGFVDTSVDCAPAGPWVELSTPVDSLRRLKVLAGRRLDSSENSSQIPRLLKKNIVENFRTNLNREILLKKNLIIKSGNRRLMGPAENISLFVQDGDLLVDYFGSAQSCNFKSTGSISVRGSAMFDTLRLYAAGMIALSGHVRAGWLETYSSDQQEVSGNVRFSGALLADGLVVLRQRALGEYPSALMSLNDSVEYAPRNISAPLLLPARDLASDGNSFLSGLEPFRWSLQ